MTGVSTSTFSFVPVSSQNGALVYVVISNPFSPSVKSSTVSLTVNTIPVVTSLTSKSCHRSCESVGNILRIKHGNKRLYPGLGLSEPNPHLEKELPQSLTTQLSASDDRSVFAATATNAYGSRIRKLDGIGNFAAQDHFAITRVKLVPANTQISSFGDCNTANDGSYPSPTNGAGNGTAISGRLALSTLS